MRSTVAWMTVLFAVGFLSGGSRDMPHPTGSPSSYAARAVSRDRSPDGPASRGAADPRTGFRRLSAPAAPGPDSSLRGCAVPVGVPSE